MKSYGSNLLFILFIPLVFSFSGCSSQFWTEFEYVVGWDEETNGEPSFSGAGQAYNLDRFLAEVGGYVEENVTEFNIAAKNASAEIWETDLRDYFDSVRSYQYEKITYGNTSSVAYKVEYAMHAAILHAHQNGDGSQLDAQARAVYEKALRVVSEQTQPHMTDYEKELAIHDYIVLNTRYNDSVTPQGERPKEFFTPYGALIDGEAVCEGYSAAFKLLMEMCGVECDIVTGLAKGESHSWNRVKLGGEYYLVDVTWDDPVPDQPGVIQYDYLNLTDEMMNRNHVPVTVSTKKAMASTYNYYYYNGLVVGNQQDFDAMVKKAVAGGAQTLSVVGEPINVADLDLDRVFRYYPQNFEYTFNENLNIIHIFFR